MSSSMNLLIVGDIHYASGRHIPEGRSQDYPGQVLAKLEWVRQAAIHYAAPVLLLGDLLHSKRPSDADRVCMGAWLASFRGDEIPVLAVAGNHDAPNVQTAHQASAFAMYAQTGLLHHLDPSGHGYTSQWQTPPWNIPLFVTGASYHPGYDDDSQAWSPVLPLDTQECVVHLTHGNLWLHPEAPPFPVYQPKLQFPFHGLCINGNLHAPFMQKLEKTERGQVGYINLGSLVRTSRAKVQMEHKPRALLVTVDEVGAWTVKALPVPHLPAEEVFEESKIQTAASDSDIREFAEELAASDAVDTYGNTEELLASVVRRGGYGKAVHDKARALLDQAAGSRA